MQARECDGGSDKDQTRKADTSLIRCKQRYGMPRDDMSGYRHKVTGKRNYSL